MMTEPIRIDPTTIRQVVTDSVRAAWQERDGDSIPLLTEDIILMGPASPLDSLGLVLLIVDVEQALQMKYGLNLALANERAMSLRNSPFRSVNALVDYILMLVQEQN
jgi:acyl carrier protein